jgi:hypothetical protein
MFASIVPHFHERHTVHLAWRPWQQTIANVQAQKSVYSPVMLRLENANFGKRGKGVL